MTEVQRQIEALVTLSDADVAAGFPSPYVVRFEEGDDWPEKMRLHGHRVQFRDVITICTPWRAEA